MKADSLVNSRWCLVMVLGLVMVGLSVAIPFTAGADGGNSWVRNIYNKSGETVVLTADLRAGNAWFNDSNENGPFQMGPNSSATVKYTTSGGMSYGDVFVKSLNGNLICIRSWNSGDYYYSQYDRCPSSGGDLVIR